MPSGVIIHRKKNIKMIETPIPYLNSVGNKFFPQK